MRNNGVLSLVDGKHEKRSYSSDLTKRARSVEKITPRSLQCLEKGIEVLSR